MWIPFSESVLRKYLFLKIFTFLYFPMASAPYYVILCPPAQIFFFQLSIKIAIDF